jgi:hypothetical protein
LHFGGYFVIFSLDFLTPSTFFLKNHFLIFHFLSIFTVFFCFSSKKTPRFRVSVDFWYQICYFSVFSIVFTVFLLLFFFLSFFAFFLDFFRFYIYYGTPSLDRLQVLPALNRDGHTVLPAGTFDSVATTAALNAHARHGEPRTVAIAPLVPRIKVSFIGAGGGGGGSGGGGGGVPGGVPGGGGGSGGGSGGVPGGVPGSGGGSGGGGGSGSASGGGSGGGTASGMTGSGLTGSGSGGGSASGGGSGSGSGSGGVPGGVPGSGGGSGGGGGSGSASGGGSGSGSGSGGVPGSVTGSGGGSGSGSGGGSASGGGSGSGSGSGGGGGDDGQADDDRVIWLQARQQSNISFVDAGDFFSVNINESAPQPNRQIMSHASTGSSDHVLDVTRVLDTGTKSISVVLPTSTNHWRVLLEEAASAAGVSAFFFFFFFCDFFGGKFFFGGCAK